MTATTDRIPQPKKTAKGYSVRIRYGIAQKRFMLNVRGEQGALARSASLAYIARILTESGHADQARGILVRTAQADNDAAVKEHRRTAEGIVAGWIVPTSSKGRASGDDSVETYAERWAETRHARGVRTAENTDLPRLRLHVFPLLKNKTIAEVTADDLRLVVAHLDDLAHDPKANFGSATALPFRQV